MASLEAQKGEARGQAVNASSEFAAAQYVAKLVGVNADWIAYYLIALLASLLPLFSVTMMLAAAHNGQEALVTANASTKSVLKGVDRSAAAKRGWAIRKRNAAVRAGKVIPLTV